jgi:hypothetical protein
VSTDQPHAGVGIFRAAFTKPYRWELRPGDEFAGFVDTAGEADTEDAARMALAHALATAGALTGWLEARGTVYRVDTDATAYALEQLHWRRAAIPIGVALSVVTGRRVERHEHGALVVALFDYLADGHLSAADLDSPRTFAVVKARARNLFPLLAGETGAELDEAPAFDIDPAAHGRAARAWLEEREAKYGPTIPFRRPVAEA